MDGYITPGIEEAYRLNNMQSGAANANANAAPTTSGQFGILAPATLPESSEAQPAIGASNTPSQGYEQQVKRSNGQLSTKIVIDPPNLEEWRNKLFNVDETIVLTHEEFETYFPHVDNVYSHRSTQRYKRKPFISHYWDCRMKGRPPGTPKSDDPNKKKRKRTSRQRDLCDVKIKITEYFPDAHVEPGENTSSSSDTTGQRLWTIQRVNGNGGNGKGDGVAGPHKHTLERSDEIKKSSVQRYVAKQGSLCRANEKAKEKSGPKATGAALATIRRHAKENNFKFYASCICPFSQRVWIALEAKAMSYQYCETSPFSHTEELLLDNPRDCLPIITHDDWECSDSAVILEYLEDLGKGTSLLPSDPRLKAKCRLWTDHINRHVVPNFYNLVQNRETSFEHEAVERLQDSIDILVRAADDKGPLFLDQNICLVDVHLAPFALRFTRVLAPLHKWRPPPPGSRWARWLDAIEGDVSVGATTSNRALYNEIRDTHLGYGVTQ
ncbi:hypothetical protein NW752_009975 [Fusarium irregulare]|nr:hypothetical protein NW752_009975 [Fusarium irregulare]